eukprot:3142528-Amphidinium_carterae.2
MEKFLPQVQTSPSPKNTNRSSASSACASPVQGDELQMGALARLGGNEEGLDEMRIAGLRAEVR